MSATIEPRSMWATAPWTDARGGFSWVRALVFAGLLVPALLLLADAVGGTLGARPWDAAIHRSGWWAMTLLLLSLAVTPVSRVLRWSALVPVRRMVGVSAFLAAALHLVLFAGDHAWRLDVVAGEIVLRWYLAVGFVALLGLAALAATSTDGMIRRLGGRRWRALHRCVYLLAGLAVLHFYMQSKLVVTEPVLYAALLFWLLGWRAARRLRGGEPSAPGLVALAVAAALVAAVLEAAAITASAPVPLSQVLLANVDPDLAAGRPAAWVLAAGLGVAVAGWARRRGLRHAGIPAGMPARP